jgi:hypothetical protein
MRLASLAERRTLKHSGAASDAPRGNVAQPWVLGAAIL